jgi:nitrogen regulatory protein PII
MTNCILIIDNSKNSKFEDFLKTQTTITAINLEAKSTSRNFLLALLNLSDVKKNVYFIKTKTQQLKKLEDFCHETLNKNQSGLLIKLKKEEKSMEKQQKSVKKPSKNVKNDKLVVTIVKSGFVEIVLNSTKNFEVSGATILNGKGIGQSETEVMGMEIESHREVILIATTSDLEKKLISALKQALTENGNANGIIFSLPIADFVKFDKKQ